MQIFGKWMWNFVILFEERMELECERTNENITTAYSDKSGVEERKGAQ